MRKSYKSEERQQQILNYIKEYLLEKGYPPAIREICTAVGLKSSSTVHLYLDQLEQNSLIKRNPTKPRAIDILEEKPWEALVEVPLLKNVITNKSLLAKQNIKNVYSLSQSLLKTTAKTFMVKVTDDSLKRAGIFNGDLVIAKEQAAANDGEIVVELVNHNKIAVNKFNSENKASTNVIGKVIGVYRQI